jgi:hypothetical protein
MTTTFSWAETRERAISLFDGEHPNAVTEQDIIDVFKTNPNRVITTLQETATAKRSGSVRSGWAIWRKRVTTQPPPDLVITDETEREQTVGKATRWVRHVGYLIDRESELLDALFGHDGFGGGPARVTLKPWDTPELRAEMLALWNGGQP